MKKILVIDDEKNIRETIQELLELKGYEVITARDGHEGFVMASRKTPDLIICDVMMPNLDGFETIKLMRKHGIIGKTAFIFLTAKSEKQDRRLGMELGADDFLTKPFSASELFSAIEIRLNRNQEIKEGLKARLEEFKYQMEKTFFHEFNTPLNGILGGAELLKMYGDEFDRREKEELIDAILKSGRRMKKLLDNNVLYNRLKDAGNNPELLKNTVSGGPCQAEQVIPMALAQVSNRYNRPQDLKSHIEPAMLSISENNLHYLVDELLDNALKFSDEGKSVQISGSIQEGFYVLSIQDRGRGMSAEDLAHVEAYTQFNRDIHEQQGLGLGLVNVFMLLNANRINFEIDTAPKQGFAIRMSLPLFLA